MRGGVGMLPTITSMVMQVLLGFLATMMSVPLALA